jgi:Ni,Fe-hydrogenase III component G
MDDTLNLAKELLAEFVSTWDEPEGDRLDAQVAASSLYQAVRALQAAEWGYLATITGLDTGEDQNRFELLYHFCLGSAVLTLRVTLSDHEPEVPSICDILPYATIFEREVGEMFGIRFDGTPDTSRLFLADDWPEDVFPLRKDFEGVGDEHK